MSQASLLMGIICLTSYLTKWSLVNTYSTCFSLLLRWISQLRVRKKKQKQFPRILSILRLQGLSWRGRTCVLVVQGGIVLQESAELAPYRVRHLQAEEVSKGYSRKS